MPRIHDYATFTPLSSMPGASPQPQAEGAAAHVPADWFDRADTTAGAAERLSPRRTLVPPVIDWPHVAQSTGCLRPVRRGGMRLETQWQRDRLVVHNYGHGGAGWTLAPGVVAESLRLFDDAHRGALARAPITVLGGGVIGLWTALTLAKRPEAPPITIMADSWTELASHNAGGLLAPVSLQDNPGAQVRTQAMGAAALKVWESIAQGELGWARRGARQMPVFVGMDTDSGLDDYVRAGLLPRPRDVSVAFAPDKVHAMRVYDTLFIDVARMMRNLHTALVDLKVERVTARVHNLDDIDSQVIFNCTGLGARQVCNDAQMLAVQGHLMRLRDQPPAHARDYMIYTQIKQAQDARSDDRRDIANRPPAYLYYMPKGEGVIGGTFIPGAKRPDDNPDAFEGIVSRAQHFFGAP